MFPLRPVVLVASRATRRGPGPIWRSLTQPFGGQERLYRLRDGGRSILIRQGTPDIFSIYEMIESREYAPPPEAAAAVAALGHAPRVLDLGANIGLFGLYALSQWPDGQITSIEADPDNMRVLDSNVSANSDADWTATCAFASDREGEVAFASGHFAVSRGATDGGARANSVVPALDAFDLLANCDFAKIDIEGGEWPILADPRLADAPARVIALEFHPWGAPGEDAGSHAAQLLGAAGYETAVAFRNDDGTGIIWGWRPSP